MARIDRERVERVARIYATSQAAGRALGIAAGSFCRLCRKYGIETPYARRTRDYLEPPPGKGPPAMIRLAGIEKYYTSGSLKTYVLRNINLEIKEGECVSIMGPSGAGKSTLLHIIGMIDDPSGGQYHFLDQAVHSLGEKQRTALHRQYIGFVFQSYHLVDELTVYENLEMPLLYQQVKGPERQGRVCELLDRFQLAAKKDLFPSQKIFAAVGLDPQQLLKVSGLSPP